MIVTMHSNDVPPKLHSSQKFICSSLIRSTLMITISKISVFNFTHFEGWCYFPSVGTEIKCNNSLFSVRMDGNLYAYIGPTLFSVRRDGKLQLNFAIFRPYGRKFTAKFRYFPSLRTQNSGIQRLTDGNQELNFAIFCPYKQMAPHYCPRII